MWSLPGRSAHARPGRSLPLIYPKSRHPPPPGAIFPLFKSGRYGGGKSGSTRGQPSESVAANRRGGRVVDCPPEIIGFDAFSCLFSGLWRGLSSHESIRPNLGPKIPPKDRPRRVDQKRVPTVDNARRFDGWNTFAGLHAFGGGMTGTTILAILTRGVMAAFFPFSPFCRHLVRSVEFGLHAEKSVFQRYRHVDHACRPRCRPRLEPSPPRLSPLNGSDVQAQHENQRQKRVIEFRTLTRMCLR